MTYGGDHEEGQDTRYDELVRPAIDISCGKRIHTGDSHEVVTRDQERLDEGGNGGGTHDFGGDRPILPREVLDVACRL